MLAHIITWKYSLLPSNVNTCEELAGAWKLSGMLTLPPAIAVVLASIRACGQLEDLIGLNIKFIISTCFVIIDSSH